jgi:hypothetical protein
MEFKITVFNQNGSIRTTKRASTRKLAKAILRDDYKNQLAIIPNVTNSSIGMNAYRILSKDGNRYGIIEKVSRI